MSVSRAVLQFSETYVSGTQFVTVLILGQVKLGFSSDCFALLNKMMNEERNVWEKTVFIRPEYAAYGGVVRTRNVNAYIQFVSIKIILALDWEADTGIVSGFVFQ
jgi:allantoicase